MTPQQIEALKLALEALEGFYEYGYDRQECFEHITAIKEALAEHAMQEVQRLGQEIEQEQLISDQINYGMSVTQGGKRIDPMSIYKEPEQEPVAWPCLIDSADFSENTITLVMQCADYKVSAGTHWLSITPPQRTWVGLTEQEHTDIAVECGCMSADWVFYGAAVERKLKERNT